MTGSVALAEKVKELPRDEEPWPLPQGWIWTPLKRLSSFIGRGRGPTYVESGGVPVVNQKCIRWRRLEKQHLKLTSRDAFDRLATELHIRTGDLLWNSTGTGTIGRAVVYDGSIPELTIDSHVTLVRPTSVEPSYLGYFIETLRVQHLVIDEHVGSTNQQELPRSFVEELLIPLPPSAEQGRIVARLDALFAEIADGAAALAMARKGLDIFRRALLKAAVSGELTNEWRQEQAKSGVDAETGHDLLARVVENRATKAFAKGRGRRNADKPPINGAARPALPPGWAWATLGELFDISTGSTPSRSDPTLWNGGVPWVSSGEVAFCRIRTTKETISTAGLGNPATRLNPAGTVLLAMIGEGKTRGQCAILDVPAANNQNAAAIRVSASPIPPEFVYQVLEERYFRSRRESQGGNQPALNGGKVAEMAIPLPPSNEIVELLRLVSEARSTAADTLSMLDAEAADAERLKQSILKAAFEGRLVSQDPADEPASALLNRSAADRATTNSKRGSAKRVS
jgi:type I restriction enzyme, S subunit